MTRKATVNKAEIGNPIQRHEEKQTLSLYSVIQDQENLISYLNTLSELTTSLL